MLFGIIGGIALCITLSISDKIYSKKKQEEELRKAAEEGYEVYFA